MEQALKVQNTKEMLIDYVPSLLFSADLILTYISQMWKGVSFMRGTVANKARETIGDAVGLSGIKREDIAEAVEWLLKDLKKVCKGGEGNEDISLPFISGDLDIKVCSMSINVIY